MADSTLHENTTTHKTSGKRRAAARERMRRVRSEHPERERERARLWRENNRQRDNEISKNSKARRKSKDPLAWNVKAAARKRARYAKDPRKHLERQKTLRLSNLEERRAYERSKHLEYNYGITSDQRDAMLAGQGGVCAICGSGEHRSRNWHVDHSHETGQVRAILCGQCNTGIGYARESVEILQKMIAYLKHHGRDE